ncbi:hypothetical protein PsYK624_101040 [Phanerochaete sordida]|uniref:Uncharacterized protein n=1 Tax=Phanerochaete sordida TaxID=48140 RepID=A0A9P3LGS5_9APHY|nr:hypothetical protein PsYK624_101040 [Phanerochaete sordida]
MYEGQWRHQGLRARCDEREQKSQASGVPKMLGTYGSWHRHDIQRSGVAGGTHEAERSATLNPDDQLHTTARERGRQRTAEAASENEIQHTLKSGSEVPAECTRRDDILLERLHWQLPSKPAARVLSGCHSTRRQADLSDMRCCSRECSRLVRMFALQSSRSFVIDSCGNATHCVHRWCKAIARAKPVVLQNASRMLYQSGSPEIALIDMLMYLRREVAEEYTSAGDR